MSESFEQNVSPQRRGYRSFFWPVVLIGVGVIWLLVNLNIIPIASIGVLLRFWPVLLILIGIDIIFSRHNSVLGAIIGLVTIGLVIAVLLVGGSWLTANAPSWLRSPVGFYSTADIKSRVITEPLGETTAAEIRLNLSQFHTQVDVLDDPATLFNADLDYVGELDYSIQGTDRKVISLAQQEAGLVFNISDASYRWAISLPRDTPVELVVDSASGSNEFNLQEMQLTRLTFTGGSGSTQLALPVTEAQLPAKITTRSGSFRFSMPDHSMADLEVDSGSGSVQYELGAESDVMLDWQSASGSLRISIGANTDLEAKINSGSGSVTIDIPNDAALRVEVLDKGSGSISLPDGLRQLDGDRDEGTWESSDYGTAARRILIVLDTGSGSVTIN